ncbi:hypothetical protein RJ639_008282 [Escallonia herrerae]|uniref:Uncharacterized protein n=1 Tax=Escallonia herrerae TaxID=1293975 RepID=A0AA89ARU3_9ASTE|nr:hypothetical protein RJ639_008282 [Escallonia herrerae]
MMVPPIGSNGLVISPMDRILVNIGQQAVSFQPEFLRLLKVLDLSHSPGLTETPDFSGLSNLERVILKDCKSLVKVFDIAKKCTIHYHFSDDVFTILLSAPDENSASPLEMDQSNFYNDLAPYLKHFINQMK